MRDAAQSQNQISMGSMQQAMFSQQSNQAHAGQSIRQSQTYEEHGLTQAQRALVLTIGDGLKSVNQAQSELDTRVDIPQLGSDAVSSSNYHPWQQIQERVLKIFFSFLNQNIFCGYSKESSQ